MNNKFNLEFKFNLYIKLCDYVIRRRLKNIWYLWKIDCFFVLIYKDSYM